MKLESKRAIVTGAARGVGRATALELARRGCSVVVNFRSSAEDAAETVAEIRKLGVTAIAHQADVADDAACRELADLAARELGGIDLLVNNAGFTKFIPHSDLEAVTAEDWRQIMDVNVLGPFQLIRACLPHLQAAADAEIVNVASIAGFTTAGSSIPYGASKAALINLTVNLARALSPNIRVNAIAPGFIDGQWLRDGLGEDFETARETVSKNTALGKVCLPEDVADAIVSLIAGSDCVTGQTLVVDAGQTIGPKVS